MRRLRTTQIAAILPNAKSQLNPLTTVGAMLRSALQAHEKISKKAAEPRATRAVGDGRITDPGQPLERLPP